MKLNYNTKIATFFPLGVLLPLAGAMTMPTVFCMRLATAGAAIEVWQMVYEDDIQGGSCLARTIVDDDHSLQICRKPAVHSTRLAAA